MAPHPIGELDLACRLHSFRILLQLREADSRRPIERTARVRLEENCVGPNPG